MKKLIIMILIALSAEADEREERFIPPEEYGGIKLLKNRLDEVVHNYGEAELFDVPNSHHEEGYCYTSSNGVSVIFSGGVELTQIQISNIPISSFCKEIGRELKKCIGNFCLGDSEEMIEEKVGRELTETTTGTGSKVAYFEYQRPLSPSEADGFSYDVKAADVQHNLWATFSESGAESIGIIKFETF